MKTKERVLELLLERKKLSTQDVVSHFRISRQYANSILRELTKEGRVLKIGSTKSSIYVLPQYAKHIDVIIKKRLRNEYLEEHKVLNDIENQLLPLSQFSDNTRSIFEYAFSEMLNNAIEHSQSEFINIEAKRNKKFISFIVDDFGIGVYQDAGDYGRRCAATYPGVRPGVLVFPRLCARYRGASVVLHVHPRSLAR